MAYGIGGNTTGYNTHVEGTGGFCSITFESENAFEGYEYTKETKKVLMPKEIKGIKSVPNVAIVGSPTVKDGVVSGFSTSNYLVLDNKYKSNNATYVFKFTTGDNITTQQCVVHAELLFNLEMTTNGQLDTWLFGSQTSKILFTLNTNTTYWVKVEIDGNSKTYSYSTDGQNFNLIGTYEDTGMDVSNTSYQFRLGLSSYELVRAFLGSIDLKECYIDIDGERSWNGMKDQQENVYLACR